MIWLFRTAVPLPFPNADIITLSSGERINPNPIEARVKRHIPIVRYVVVVGQDAPYLCALLTLKVPHGWPGASWPPRGGGGGCCRPGFRTGSQAQGRAGPLGERLLACL